MPDRTDAQSASCARLHPQATLSAASLAAVAHAYGLGEPLESIFIARGAMGAVNRITTLLGGDRMYWTVKRAYWNFMSEEATRREVGFTATCRSAGIPAPRSVSRIDDGRFLLTVHDQPDGGSQYRVLAWVVGEVGNSEDDRTVAPITEWMARIHRLAVDPKHQPIDDWFVRVTFDWAELAKRLQTPAPDIAEVLHARRADLQRLTDLVNSTREPGAVWCHADLGADNLIWSDDGPQF
jgi:Ser/Thr protein kinase RdoA (MazF antagonist)